MLDQDLITLLCTQFSSVKEPDKPLHLLSTLMKSLFIVRQDHCCPFSENPSSLLSKTVFVLSVCTRLVNAVLANIHIFLLAACSVFKPL